MKQVIFFDLDGTLWDAVEEIKNSWNEAMINANLKYRFTYSDIKSHMGLTPVETGEVAFNDVDSKTQLDYFFICYNNEVKYLALHPGVLYKDEKEVLDILHNKYDLYIVSNCEKGYIENYLNNNDMAKYFSGHLCAGDTKKDKWENIIYLQNKIKADQVIYVGDTYKDMIQSNKANVTFIHASYGFGEIENPPYKINNLKELPQVIDKIFK